jgi:hypothetical protein
MWVEACRDGLGDHRMSLAESAMGVAIVNDNGYHLGQSPNNRV